MLDALNTRFGLESFRPGQRGSSRRCSRAARRSPSSRPAAASPSATSCPALLLDGVTVVVSPLIALMKDQIDFLRRQRHRGGAARLEPRPGRGARGLRNGSATGSAEAALRRAGALRQRALPRAARADADRAVRGRRGALHLRVGPQLPPRLPEARRAAPATSAPSACWRSPPPPRPRSSRDICAGFGIDAADAVVTGFYRPNLTLLTHAGRSGRARMQLLLERLRARPPGPTIVYVTLQRTAERVAAAARRAPGCPRARTTPGWSAEERAAVQDWWMAVDRDDRGGDDRLRHGHRQGRHPLRLPLQPAQEPRELQPGDRPRRPRRRARASASCSPARDDVPTLENFAYGDTPTREAHRRLLVEVLRHDDGHAVRRLRVRASERHDVRPLVLRTVLTYLELEGLLRQGTPFYAGYSHPPGRGLVRGRVRAVRRRARRLPPPARRERHDRAQLDERSTPTPRRSSSARAAIGSSLRSGTSRSGG